MLTYFSMAWQVLCRRRMGVVTLHLVVSGNLTDVIIQQTSCANDMVNHFKIKIKLFMLIFAYFCILHVSTSRVYSSFFRN